MKRALRCDDAYAELRHPRLRAEGHFSDLTSPNLTRPSCDHLPFLARSVASPLSSCIPTLHNS